MPTRMPRCSILLFAAILTACTCEPPLVEGPAHPAMWVVQDEDTRIIILGSVHQLPPDLEWTGGILAPELAAADELILELAPAELAKAPGQFASTSSDEPVPSLDQRFGQATAERVRDYAADAGIDADDIERMESWALALAIGNVITADTGLTTDNGVETRVTAAFTANNRPIRGLESATLQLAMFDDLSDAAQNAMVTSAIARSGEARTRTRRLLTAWARGDTAALAIAADEAMADTPALIEPVIHARNRTWADALARRMERRGEVLVAVGAGHLVGEASLIEELRTRGFTARRLQ